MEERQSDARTRATRVEVDFEGVLTAADGYVSRVVVRDLSAEGFRVEVTDDLHVGELVSLQIGKEPAVSCKIKWIRGSEAGGTFL